jgi:hypothetical protein
MLRAPFPDSLSDAQFSQGLFIAGKQRCVQRITESIRVFEIVVHGRKVNRPSYRFTLLFTHVTILKVSRASKTQKQKEIYSCNFL